MIHHLHPLTLYFMFMISVCPCNAMNKTSGKLFQRDTLDFLYRKYEIQTSLYTEAVSIITDKKIYFSGTDVSFFATVTPSLQGPVRSSWVFAFLFAENGEIIKKIRLKLKENTVSGSLRIPTNFNLNEVFLGIISPNMHLPAVAKLRIANEKDNQANIEYKIVTNDGRLLSDNKCTLLINASNDPTDLSTLQITDGNDAGIEQHWSDNKERVEFIPSLNTTYFLNLNGTRIPLPHTVTKARIQTQFDNDHLKVTVTEAIPDDQDNMIMLFSGKEMLWLSEIRESTYTVELPLEELNSSLLFCFVLDKSLNIVNRKVLSIASEKSVLKHRAIYDTLNIEISRQYNNRQHIVSVTQSNYNIAFPTFTPTEIRELSSFGPIHSNMFFTSAERKMHWLNNFFKIDLAYLLRTTDPENANEIKQIAYRLPDDVKINDNLLVNCLDFDKKLLIDHQIKDRNILLNINDFKDQGSLLVLNASYKKRKLELPRDSLREERYLTRIVNQFLKRTQYIQHSSKIDLSTQIEQLINLEDAIVLDEVTVFEKKFRISNPQRGTTKTYEELELTNNTVTALSILPQIGVFKKPAIAHTKDDTGLVKTRLYSQKTGEIKATRGFRHGLQNPDSNYPLYLVIQGPEYTYYSGTNFDKLFAYPAEWVYSITKNESFPEGVIVQIIPNFRGVQSFVKYEKIFSESDDQYNSENSLRQVQENVVDNKIKVPLAGLKRPLDITVHSVDRFGNVEEYQMFYDE